LINGASIGFMKGEISTLMEDIKLLKPTFLPAVPRLLNKVYDVIIQKAEQAGFIKWTIFHMGINGKLSKL